MTLTITTLNDLGTLLDINNAAIPDINQLTPLKAQWLIDHLAVPGLALLDGRPAGVVVVLNDRCGYDSDYYRWFTERYENFLYIDRVIVAGWARRQGIAKALYEHVESAAKERKLAIVADVYSDPPNTPSLALHRAMDYDEIGTQAFPAEQKIATKFMKYGEHARPKR
jgi:predicted GNAT superfamily acetyltransferase